MSYVLIAYLLVKTHKFYQNQKNGKIKTLLGKWGFPNIQKNDGGA